RLLPDLPVHCYDTAPYRLAGAKKEMEGEEIGLSGNGDGDPHANIDALALAESERALVGGPGENGEPAGVIDPDMLWSCTNCGACVEQCPVDIEHVDHIVDMRRYQVMIESNVPTELNATFEDLHN